MHDARSTHRRRAVPWLLFVLALAGAAAFVVEARLGTFRKNHLRYLVNDHQYLAALNGYRRLATESGGDPIPGFEAGLLARARGYYTQLNMNPGSVEERAYQRFLDEVIARLPKLAGEARRQRLELLAARDGATSGTLAAAEDILERQYDPEALWWMVRCQYRPERPLAIPRRLLDFSSQIERQAADTKIEPRDQARARFLNAILNLAEQNWAAAAALIENSAPPDKIDTGMALGIALLRAGRPESAIRPLERVRRQRPDDPLALEWLAESYLAARAYPWALQAFRELYRIDPAAGDRALREAIPAGGRESDPFEALCAATALEPDLPLWSFLEHLAPAQPRSGLAAEAASRMLALKPLSVDELAVMAEGAARRDDARMRAGIEARLDAIGDPAAMALLSAIRTQTPRATHRLNLFLAGPSTQRATIQIPRRAHLIVLEIQGYPAGSAWPIVNIDMGALGRRTVDACESRAQARPFFFVLPNSTSGPVEISASLLNSGAGLNAMIVNAIIY